MAQVLREGVTGAGWLAGSVPTATYAIMSMNNDRSGLMDRVDILSLLFFFSFFSLYHLWRDSWERRAGDGPFSLLPKIRRREKEKCGRGRKTEYIHFGTVEACGILF